MTNEKFEAEKVYIALRPGIFPKLDDQHITVEYIGDNPRMAQLEFKLRQWKNRFQMEKRDLRVEITGYANWRTFNAFYEVALVRFPDLPKLNFTKNWHITLKKSPVPVANRVFVDEECLVDYVDTLWVGYKVNGEFQWCPAYAVRQVFQQIIAKKTIPQDVMTS